MINFLNMKYFLVVAETRSFSAAAKQLYISQQTLSAHIAQMESEIGTKLFERTRPLSLTLAGERFLRGVREILFINSQMERELQDIIDPHSNAFRVAISHAYARSILPVILRQFYSRFPQVNLQLYEMSYKEMDKALAAGKIDLIISRTFHHGANVNVIPLYNDDDVYLYAPFSTLRQVYGDKMPEILEGIDVLAKAAQATRVIVLIPKRFKPSGDLSSTPIKELVKKSFFKEASPKVASKMEGPTEQGEISSLEETVEQGVHVAEIAVEELPVSSMEYNSENQTVLMSVVPTREYYKLKEGIHNIDKNAFFVAMDSYEVKGGA